MTDSDPAESPERGLVVRSNEPAWKAGTLALAALPDDEFDARLAAMKAGQQRVARIQRELLEENVDYGVIPGTKLPTLLKPGAEKLCAAYQLVAEMRPEVVYGDGQVSPHVTYRTQCLLHLGSIDGPVVADGWGVSNSWERKYRWRQKKAEILCPECGRPGVRFTSREVWWHPMDAAPDGGCNKNFKKDDPAITGQPRTTEMVENPDPFDAEVTLLKMSEKRALVDATLRATATSGLFTQDVEDLVEGQSREIPSSHPSTAPVVVVPQQRPAERPTQQRPVSLKCSDGGVIGPEPCTKDRGHEGPHQSLDGVWPQK